MSDSNDLFAIRLSDEGIRLIKKFATANKLLILAGLVLCVVHLVSAIIRFVNSFDDSGLDPFQVFYFRSFPYSIILYASLFGMQLLYYWKFRKLLTDSIKSKNEITFNAAFKAIYRNAIWGIVTIILALILGVVDILYFFQYLI